MEKVKLFKENQLANILVAAIMEHKVIEPTLIKLKGRSSLADWFLVLSVESKRQIQSVADNVIRKVKENGIHPLGVEGLNDSTANWILIDLDNIIVHIFSEEARDAYDLESLWLEVPQMRVDLLV